MSYLVGKFSAFWYKISVLTDIICTAWAESKLPMRTTDWTSPHSSKCATHVDCYVWRSHPHTHSGPMQNDICCREGTWWSRMTGLWPLSELTDMLWKWWSMACWKGSKCSKNLPKEHHLLTAYVIHSLSWHPMEHMHACIKERQQINICLCAHLSWLTPWGSRVNIWTVFLHWGMHSSVGMLWNQNL